MIDQEQTVEQHLHAQQMRLREGLETIEKTQAGLFSHLESLAAHVVALEALVAEALRDHPVRDDVVFSSIKNRIGEQGVPLEAASPALEIARTLITASR